MYFLTNKEDYIVAASSDFLTAIGSRDVCSISALLQNKLIAIDKEHNILSISNKDLGYEYQISNMHSAFGNLDLYTLKTPVSNTKTDDNEDENIAYLKKIQEGTVERKDNEYAIPTISTLQKDTNKEIMQVDKVAQAKEETLEKIEETKEIAEAVKIPNIPEVAKLADIEPDTVKIPEVPIVKEEIENIELAKTENGTELKIDEEKEFSTEENKSKSLEKAEDKEENSLELNNSDLLNALKNIDTKSENNTEIKIPKDESIEKLADEIIENKKAQRDVQSIEKVETSIDNTKITEDDELIKRIQNIDNSKPTTKESGLKKITKKLFPWGSKKTEDIELEDNTAYETNLKSASELEDKKVKTVETIKETIDSTKEIAVEKTPEITIEEENEILEKIKTINLENEHSTEETELAVETETLNAPSVECENEDTKTAKVDIAEPKVEELKIEQKIEDNLKETINKIETPSTNLEKTEIETTIPKIDTEVEEIETALTLGAQKDIENPIVAEEDELAVLKEQITNIDSKPQVEQKKTTIVESSEDTRRESSKIVYKLIGLQVDAINLEENANKLSIDTSSYKMLLGNYLDEIDKYNGELESGATSTIEMLKDAGELLSLNILTKKLEELKTSNDKRAATKEISLIASLLKEKAEKKPAQKIEEINVVTVPQVAKEDVKKEVITTKEEKISIPPIPDEIIDITSAQDLLTSISSQSVTFNPNRAADELNLPKTLILEFVEDFISQSKEHLPIIVDAYKKEDIKTIQTTAHMLKGAASNLRLDTIAENLFKIQKESNVNNSGELIKQFVSKLKGLASEVASLEDAEDEN